jgi:predicted phosphoribosyltransferase
MTMIKLPFPDRAAAARELAARLAPWRGRRPLVLAIPRGAVPMGRIIADSLAGELDVVLVRKLGAPGNPELAIGSVDETGHVYIAAHTEMLGVSSRYIEQETRAQLEVMRSRRREYTPVRAPIDPAGRIVIVVDDGIATGSTMIAALRAVRARKPQRLIAAMGVAPPETLANLRREADEVVCLATPEYFHAVGQFFMSFPQVGDAEVVRLLSANPQE